MLKPDHENRRAHLRRALERSKLKQAEFARRIGVTPSYLSQMLQEGFRFGEKAARVFEEKLHLPRGSFEDSLDKQLFTVEVWETPDDLPAGVFAIVPRISVQLAAGAGSIQGEEMDLPPLAFREDWLRRKCVTSKSNLRVCDVKGDSMEPYLQDGDAVLIDIGQQDIIDNEIYALNYGGELRIKRLARRFDSGIIIRSDNPRYPEEVVTAREVDMLNMVGRMLWRGG